MATLYPPFGAKEYRSPTKETNFQYGVIAKNSEVFTKNDIVTDDGTNGMLVAGATDSVLGIVVRSQTMPASNQTVEKIQPAYIPIDQDYEFLMGTNADLDPLTSPTTYYKLTGTTGTQQVDVGAGAQTGANRVVVCTGVDPLQLGGTGPGSGLTMGLFKFVKVFNVRSNT